MCTRCKASYCGVLTGALGVAGLYTFAANVKTFRDISLFCSVPAQVGNQALAAECAASYLLFYPTDEPMLERMKQYRTELGEDTVVTAREVVTTPGLYFLALPCPIRGDHSPGDKKGNVFHCRCVPSLGLKKLVYLSLLVVCARQGPIRTEPGFHRAQQYVGAGFCPGQGWGCLLWGDCLTASLLP